MNTTEPELAERKFMPARRPTPRRYVFAVAVTLGATLLRMALEPWVHDKLPFAGFIIAIVAAAWFGGFGPSFVPFVSGFFLANFLFMEPRYKLEWRDEQHFTSDLSYAMVGFSIIIFGRAMHLARQRADANARQAVKHQKQLELEIADRKKAEDEVRQLNADLERRVELRTAELVEINHELESFTYSVSHDLRAPLRHVDGFAQILEEEYGKLLPSEAQAYTRRIRAGSQNMGRLVDDLLNLSRVGKKELTRRLIELRPMVDTLVEEIKSEMPERKIEWQIADLPSLECDAGLMRQVFTNLLANSLKYTRPRECARIDVGTVKVNGETAIYVKDNGVGFNMKYADKLFGVFQRLHRPEDFEGTGVGLATVARIVRKHGGRVWAESEPDKGATFFFTIDMGNGHSAGQSGSNGA